MGVFTMPSLGADMEAGTLVEWMVKPGDTVKRGDIVAVVETQKGAIEIEIFEEVVQSLEAELGTTLPVGAPLALIGDGAAAAAPKQEPEPSPSPPPAAAQQAAPAEPEPAEAQPERAPEPKAAETGAVAPAKPVAAVPEPPAAPAPPAPAVMVAPAVTSDHVAASPAARAGGGEGDRSRRSDRLLARRGNCPRRCRARPGRSRRQHPQPAWQRQKPARGFDIEAMRQGIAAAMTRSKREIPHYYMSHEADLAKASEWLAQQERRCRPRRTAADGRAFRQGHGPGGKSGRRHQRSFRQGRYSPGPNPSMRASRLPCGAVVWSRRPSLLPMKRAWPN
jgi:pyruvate dehydrogenase E2 component (dihydrolipoamide acetyltransferase)